MMSGGKKMVVTAIILIVCGLVLSGVALALMGGIQKIETKSEKKTHVVDEKFTEISIDVDSADVRLVLSNGGECKVECTESDTVYHTVEVKRGALEIKSVDRRKWYEHFSIGLNFESMEVTVYLPEREYDELFISSKSGDITVGDSFSFGDADVSSMSGNTTVSASVANKLSAKSTSGNVTVTNSSPSALKATSTSGDVMLSSVNSQGEVYAKTTSGEISSENVRAEAVDCASTSGDVLLRDVTAEKITCATVSGDIRITDSDASRLKLKTTSGDVSGTLKAPKIFKTSTVSGNVNAVSERSDSECEVSTVSGDISITTAGR